MTIKQITILLIVGGFGLFSCSRHDNLVKSIESSDDIDTTFFHESNIEEFGKSDLKFIISPKIALSIFAILENEECTLSEYIEKLNNNLPRDYSEDGINIVVERIIRVGNTLYVKIKVPNSVTELLSDPVELELMRLIFKDYIISGSNKYEVFKKDITLLYENGMDICYQIKSPDATKLITIVIK